jgi:uncharacterized protein YjbI with pentapeptide repeats
MRLCIQLPDRPFLRGAKLPDGDLSNAEAIYEKGTALWKRGADLSHADLSGHVTEEQLARANDLKDLTMPNDQKYED